MKKYANKEQVNIGDKIMFDNKINFFKDMLKIKMIGDVTEVNLDGDLIEVAFNINGVKDPIVKTLQYFLCQ